MQSLDTFFSDNLGPINIDYSRLLSKDRKILVSFKAQLSQGIFFTERQANLLVKILKDNKKEIKKQVPEVDQHLTNPTWSKDFRIIEKFRNVVLEEGEKSEIIVKFNFDRTIKDKIYEIVNRVTGKFIAMSATEYKFSFNVRKEVLLVNELTPHNFTYDKKIQKIYQEIQEIVKHDVSKFDILKTNNEKLLAVVKQDVGNIDEDNLMLLQDRKFRYQYKITEKCQETTLASKIANRPVHKVFINSDFYSLNEVVSALTQLNRFSTMVVFEGHSSSVNKEMLNLVAKAVKGTDIERRVGIYFRFDSKQDPAGFNKAVGELEFNKPLSSNTKIAGIANNKLPKFMLKNHWRPSSVISFTNNFKSNKSSIYATSADLIIFYSTLKPLSGNIYDIV
jgi:predicted DNA-binding antitoxin AbrB/MazE fold protein